MDETKDKEPVVNKEPEKVPAVKEDTPKAAAPAHTKTTTTTSTETQADSGGTPTWVFVAVAAAVVVLIAVLKNFNQISALFVR